MPSFSKSDKKDAVKDSKPVTTYNYPTFKLYKSEVSNNKDVTGKPYLAFNYRFSKSESAAMFLDSSNSPNTTYYPSNAFVFGLLHNNIDGVDFGTDANTSRYAGELVIEHTAPTTTVKVYSCFLIQNSGSNSGTANDLDKIIDWPPTSNTVSTPSPSIDVTLIGNSPPVIPSQEKFIKYVDPKTNNIVYVFLNPILVKGSTAQIVGSFSNTPIVTMFDIYGASDEKVQHIGTSQENDSDNIYIDCQPTGVSGDDIQTYNLPINSSAMATNGKLDFMKMAVNFFIFVILLGGVYFTMPKLYYGTVINVVEQMKIGDAEGDRLKLARKTRLRSINYFITFSFLLTILVCFLQGFASEQTGLLTAGLFIFVIFLLSFVLIQNRKMREWKDSFANGQELGGLSHDMTQFLGGGIGYLLSKVSKFYIAMLLVFLVLLFIVYATGSISSNNFSYAMTMLAFILVPISITIRLYVDYPNDKKMPQPSPSKSTTVEGSVLNP